MPLTALTASAAASKARWATVSDVIALVGLPLAADGVHAEHERAGDRDERQQGDGRPALRLHPRGGGGHLAAALAAPGEQVLDPPDGRAGSRCRRRPSPAPRRRRSRPRAPTVASASGIGAAVGCAGERLGGPDRDEGLRLVGRADLGGLERERAVAALAVRRDEPRVQVLDRGLGVERDQRVLEGVGADAGDDVRGDEAERVADVELAAPDLGHELRGGQAALAVGVRQGRQAGLADQVGLGGADGRDVQLAAPDHGDRDADRARTPRRAPCRSGRAGG